MKKADRKSGRYRKTLREQVKENPRLAATYVILRVLVVLVLIARSSTATLRMFFFVS